VSDPGYWHDDEGGAPAPGGLLDGLAAPGAGNGLALVMDPQDIASIPGLPQNIYDDAARYDQGPQDPGVPGAQRVAQAVTNGQSAPAPEDGEAALDADIRNLKDEAVDGAVSAAKGKGQATVYTRGDGRTYSLAGTIPNRDNNPLDVEYGALAQSHGAIGKDGKFAIFGSPADGFNAAMANLDRMTWHGSMPQSPPSKMTWDFWSGTAPLNALVTMSSPPTDNNDTGGMIRQITRGAHLNPGDNWGDLTDAQKLDFVHSYARREGYKGGW
jgi:hypothetical protein